MTFHWTATTLIVTAVVLAAAAGCCLISWRRSGYRLGYGLLECLRFFIILLAVLTLNQPELEQYILPDERPTIVVLYDVSESMSTRDVVTGTSAVTEPQTRSQAAAELIRPEFWDPISDQVDVVFEPFSSLLDIPEKGTDLNAALENAVQQHRHVRGIALLSDGDWNAGSAPSTAATSLRMQNIPVFAVGIGSEERLPDIELSGLDAPTFGVVGRTIRLPFRILNWMPRDRELTVTLSGTTTAPASGTPASGTPETGSAVEIDPVQKVFVVPGMGQVQDTLEWRPQVIGDYSLTLQIPIDEAETISDNNSVSFPISVRHEALSVLLVESWPRWEYRYLRNALERDPGVDVHCLLFHPDLESVGGGRGYLKEFPDEKQLFEYDVVFLGDVGIESRQLTAENCRQLRQLVRSHAGGLVLLPGFRGMQASLLTTELEELFPVIPDTGSPKGIGSARPSRYALTETGRRSLLTRLESLDEDNERTWRSLPGFHWHAAVLRAKAGTEVLVTHDAESTRFGRVPLIATRTSGTGKVLFMGTDAAWRWRKGVEDLYHYRFWGQVVRWMAYQRTMSQGESMRLFYSPDRPEAGNTVTLNANVMQASGEPLRDGTVVVQIQSPSGQLDTVRLSADNEDAWGLFSGTFTPREGGLFVLTTSCAETETTLQTEISVQGLERERIGQPARFDVLHEIAQTSRGRLLAIDESRSLLEQIADLPEPEPVVQRVRIWSHPVWSGLILLLLSVFWVGRKRAGLA